MTNPVAVPSSPVNPPFGTGNSWLKSDLLPVGVLVLLWGYLIYRLGSLWHSNPDYAYGWFVPLLCLVLLWERWKRRPHRSPVRPAGGTFLVLGLFGFALLPATLFLEIIPYWRFAGWIFAGAALVITFVILYFIGGRNWSRYFAFPLFFFLIAVPWPTRFEAPLIDHMSQLNAAASAAAANELGSPAVRRGRLIETGSGLVGVDEACSGIRSFQASVMIALFLGELFSYGILRRGVLLCGAMGLAFIGNVIRTTYLVCTADLQGLDAVKLHHDQAGLAILGITLVGLLGLVWCLKPRPDKLGVDLEAVQSKLDEMEELHNLAPDPVAAQKATWPTAAAAHREPLRSPGAVGLSLNSGLMKAALVGLVIWLGLVETGIYCWFRPAEKQAAAQAAWSFKLPVQSAEFREMPVSENIRAMLGYDEGRNAEWRDSNESVWQVFYFRWLPAETRYRAAVTAGQARGHAPEVCLKNAGMQIQTNLGIQTVSLNGVPLQVATERFLDRGRPFHIFTCYWEPKAWTSQSVPGTIPAMRSVLHALNLHDRGWNEKRVIKLGVWGKESDAAAQAGFREYLAAMIAR